MGAKSRVLPLKIGYIPKHCIRLSSINSTVPQEHLLSYIVMNLICNNILARLASVNNSRKRHLMEYSRARGFLFCDFCGTMLSLKSTKYAECPLCKFKRSAKEISEREISYVVTAEDIRRELGISLIRDQEVQLSKVKKKCEKCDNEEAEYWTMQMRSADEGQTTFYRCTKCGHKFSEN